MSAHDHQSDADYRMELLLAIAARPAAALDQLSRYDRGLVICTRLAYARLMLALAVRMEAGNGR